MPALSSALPEDSQQPIRIVSNSAVKDNKTGLTIYQGEVDISQGTLNIRADKVTIYSNEEQVVKIIAVGSPAQFKQKPAVDKADVLAKAKTIEYKLDSKQISLSDDASLDQDGSKITGNTIVYDVNAARVEAKSNKDSGPVTVVIPPQPKAEQ
ncbi:MAG: lipopolysaccharide transport periplasmic protein LptA [Pseudomonadota bacterium]